jgi:hypothetical protein
VRIQSRKWVIACLLALPPCLIFCEIKSGKAKLQKPHPPPREQKQTMDGWAAEPFVGLQTGADLRAIVGEMKFESTVALSDEEQKALTNAVVDFIEAYRKGTFEALSKFRIPVKDYHFTRSLTNAMIDHFHIPAATVRDEPMFAFQTWWYTVHKDRLYSNYWIGISPSNCQIRVEESKSITNDLITTLRLGNVPNVGFVSSRPSIVLEPTLQQVLDENGSIEVATVRIVPKPRDNDVVYPVYLRMYWSPKNGKWLPDGLVSAFSRGERKVTLFF